MIVKIIAKFYINFKDNVIFFSNFDNDNLRNLNLIKDSNNN